MRWRVGLARGLLHAGAFIRSLALMVMRPDDLIEFGRISYSTKGAVDSWSAPTAINPGLRDEEQWLLARVSPGEGELLLLGVGGGREAIPLAERGFSVTGVDFVPAMVENAHRNLGDRGLAFEGLVQEISSLAVPAGAYAVVWMSSEMYSCVPTRARRLAMLARIHQALRDDGLFVCQFRLQPVPGGHAATRFARRLMAWLTLGNLNYEQGDGLWGGAEFVHAFPSKDAALSEFSRGGFSVAALHVAPGSIRAGVVLRKSARSVPGHGAGNDPAREVPLNSGG